ncbi:MAG: dephospho-CoA kinase [Gallionella sp.]|nr:dephospho-CoA kinase [Gallionella sp.]
MKFCVGLTGGIGCGKSTVASLFETHGVGIVDTDVIAHRLTQTDGKAIPAIASAFGNNYLNINRALDRSKMRQRIFSDAPAKQCLESILHPLILTEAKGEIAKMQTPPYLILVVPLLFTSTHFQQLIQRILVVDCDEETQLARVMARSQITAVEVREIIAQQTPRIERRQRADDVIDNNTSVKSLEQQVDLLHNRYLKKQNSN